MALTGAQIKEHLLNELKNAPLEFIIEIHDYFEFLKFKTIHQEDEVFSQLSEQSFHDIWDNEEDAIYDKFLQDV